jgi:hypothetical protein
LAVLVLLVRIDGDASRLVRAAAPWTDSAQTLPSLTVVPHDYEFDGQFFYRLAVAPFSDATTVAGVTFDLPALRGSRWGLGLLTYGVTLGRPGFVPWGLLAVNCGCLVGLGLLGGGFARSSGRHALWGVLLPLWPGFAYTLTLDTAELLAAALLCGGLLAARRAAYVWAGIWSSAAVVTRETALVGALGLLIAGLWSRFHRGPQPQDTRRPRGDNGQWIAGAVAVAVFAASQLLVRGLFGQLPLASSAGNNAGLPFVGLISAVADSIASMSAGNALRLLSLLLVLGLMLVGALTIRSSTARGAEKVAWLGSAAFVLLLNGNPLVNAPSMMRASTELGVLTIIVLFGTRSRLVAPTAVGLLLVAAASLGTMLITVPPG